MSEPSAYVYRERGRVFVRMELEQDEYDRMMLALMHANCGAYELLDEGEHAGAARRDRSRIMERFDDVPALGDPESS